MELKLMKSKLKISLAIFGGAFMLLFAAFMNGFPIVYSDTSTYLASGFELETPFDRPIMYGLFLRFSSLNGVSLWFTIFCQGLLVSYLIFQLLGLCVPHLKSVISTFVSIIGILSILTSLSWTVSQLIADVFTPILILAFTLLIIGQPTKRFRMLLYVIFFLATSTHLSHISFNIILILVMLVIRQLKFIGVKEHIDWQPLVLCFFITVLSFLTMGSALSKSKHGFLMGALVEHGIAKEYLDENCEDNLYRFCAYKDSLPDKAWKFLWEEDSPFYKMGGWRGTKAEFNEIIYNTLTSRKYIFLHIRESIKATVDQLTKFKIGDGNGSFLHGTLLHRRVQLYFEHETVHYETSLQNRLRLNFLGWYSILLYAFMVISAMLLLFVSIKIRRQNTTLFSVILVVIMSILINAWASGTLANAIDRLGAKVMWLLPLIAIIGLMSIWNGKFFPILPFVARPPNKE